MRLIFKGACIILFFVFGGLALAQETFITKSFTM